MSWFKLSLPKQIAVALVAGIIVGLICKAMSESNPDLVKSIFFYLGLVGDVFLRLLKMLIVPLVFFTLAAGVTRMESPDSLRKVGGFIVIFYVLTAALSAFIGLVFALILQPGVGAEGILGAAGNYKTPEGGYSFLKNMTLWIPDNVIQAMATANMLQIIFFSIFVGVVLLVIKDKVPTVVSFVREGGDVMVKITEYVMYVAPYGIFALITILTATIGSKMLTEIMKFFVADYLGCLFVLGVVYPVLLKYFKVPVARFYKKIAPAMLVAASTTSSAATLPISMSTAEKELGIPEPIYGFGLPLGNTANMNGMAVAIGVIAVFALGLHGQAVTLSAVVQITYLGLILSIGAAGVKGGGIIISAVLLEALGMDLALLPILAAIWPIIDIPHTTTNITGDLVGTTCCASHYKQINKEVFDRA
ncbi:MAG: dicarboxylate/amino acid:cation symporter [Candidatus Accumulibacter sp.]|jgi:Na+/H+-dicarboxylate symporter|nr:dicarboxylate/amino acid:cation symporter [Accumulibacter sp.]